MKLEKLKIIDSVNNKTVHVMVTPELAQKCRTDSAFVMNLLNNVRNGAYNPSPIKSPEKKSSQEQSQTNTSIDGLDSCKLSWSNFETFKLIDLYTKHKQEFQELPRKLVWSAIAAELKQEGINKTPEKCDEKWRNMIRTFKAIKGSDRQNQCKFVFYDAVEAALQHGNQKFIQPKVEASKTFEFDNIWTYPETKALIEIYEENEDEINVKNKEWPKFWAMVSEQLQQRYVDKSPSQCEKKWKKMVEKYTKHKKGEVNDKFEFADELDRIFGDNIPEEEHNASGNEMETDANEEDTSMLNSTENTTELLDVFDKYMISKNKVLNGSQGTPKLSKPTILIKGEQKSDDEGGFMDDLLNDVEGHDGKIFWTKEETISLIKSYSKHKDEFRTCLKKRDVWQTISNELAEESFNKNAEKCETKWKNLLRTYKRLNKNCLYENKGTRFLYYQEIDNVITDNYSEEKSTPIINASINVKQEKHDNAVVNESTMPWTYNETKSLLDIYEKHRNGNNFNFSHQFWKAISDELASEKNITRDPKQCEQKMKNLKMQYKFGLSNGSQTKMKFFEEMKRIFQNSPKQEETINYSIVSNEEPPAKKTCKYRNEKGQDKQKRHEEKMSLLKKKIELEERKVRCFEKYVEYLHKKDGDISD